MAILTRYIVDTVTGMYAFKDAPDKYQGAMAIACDIYPATDIESNIPTVQVGELIHCGVVHRIVARYKITDSKTAPWVKVIFLCEQYATATVLASMQGIQSNSFFGTGYYAKATKHGRRKRSKL